MNATSTLLPQSSENSRLPQPRPSTNTAAPTAVEGPIRSLEAGARWLADSSADPRSCLETWERAPLGLAPVHVGEHTPWHVIRTDARLGDGALQALRAAGAIPGPVLLADAQVLFWVPRLTASWDSLLAGTAQTSAGPWNWGKELTSHVGPQNAAPLMCPLDFGLRRKGVRWFHAPDGSGVLTYAGALATALHLSYNAIYAPATATTPRPTTEDRPARPAAQVANFAAFFRQMHRQEAS